MANEERMQVLEMVSAGTITPQQADELLDALHDDVEPALPADEPRSFADRETRLKPPIHDIAVDDLIQLHDHGVDPAFVREMRERGLADIPIQQFVRLADHGVDPAFLEEMAAMNFTDISFDQLIQLADHGVEPSFVREMRDRGFVNLTVDQLVQLADHGVDPAFIEGMQDLKVQDSDRGES